MTNANRIIKVSGCYQCSHPDLYDYDAKGNALFICTHPKGEFTVDPNSETLPDNCPLDKEGEAESRLKTCLAVREDELYYARIDATKNIRAVWAKYDGILKYSDEYIMMEIWQTIKLTIEQADREGG